MLRKGLYPKYLLYILDGDISLVYRTETYIGALNIESELQFFKPYLEQQAILNL